MSEYTEEDWAHFYLQQVPRELLCSPAAAAECAYNFAHRLTELLGTQTTN